MDKRKKQVINHFENNADFLKLQKNKTNIYDNEFSSEYDFEDRQLELSKDEIRQYTQSKPKKQNKSSNNKTAK